MRNGTKPREGAVFSVLYFIKFWAWKSRTKYGPVGQWFLSIWT